MFRPSAGRLSAALRCRESFQLPSGFDFRTWFPMHMGVQMKKMEGKLRTVDLIIEVHDARVPISGRNPEFYQKLYAVRPHILVMNKMDLVDTKQYKESVEDYYHSRGVNHILWTDCKRRLGKSLRDLQALMLECLRGDHRFNRAVKTEYQIMVVGIPNVGKSSLINSLRSTNLGHKHSAVNEGARPGVTVRMQNRVRILDRPPVYILDTPGVLNPYARNVEETMKLALCDLILESATKPHYVADYLLYWLNRNNDTSYVDKLQIAGGPCDDINKVLVAICKSQNLRIKTMMSGSGYVDRWDFDRAVKVFVSLFRKGQLSDHCLDKEDLRYLMLRSAFHTGVRSLARGRNSSLSTSRSYQRVPPLDQPLPGLHELQYTDHKDIDPFNAEMTKLDNGLKIASEPHFGEFCTIAVAINSGSRYEIEYPFGTSHFVEKLAYASSENFRSEERRHQLLEKHGAIVDCQSTKDTFIYAASCHVNGVDDIMSMIADTVIRPLISDEEMNAARFIIASENEELNRNPQCEPLLTDWIHSAAFRGNTLGLSKYCQKENVNDISQEHLFSFMKQHHAPERMVVAGVGVDHDVLVAATKKHLDMSTATWAKNPKVLLPKIPEIDQSWAQYTGGEKRVERDLSEKGLGPSSYPNLAHVVLGFESCGYKDADFVPFCVLQSLMGGGSSFSAGGPGKGMFTRLYVDVLNQYHFMFNATSYNHSYADAGVFCISASSDPKHLLITSQIVANEFFRLVEGVEDEELKRAKIQLKSQLMMNLEVRPVMVEDLARQVIGHGYRRKPQEYLDLIDQVTKEDIKRVSERMLVSKPSVVGYGNLTDFPSYEHFDRAVATRRHDELTKKSFFSKVLS